MFVCVPDVFVLVDIDLVKLLRIELILKSAHVSDHLQGNKARQDRQHQTLLCEKNHVLYIVRLDWCLFMYGLEEISGALLENSDNSQHWS